MKHGQGIGVLVHLLSGLILLAIGFWAGTHFSPSKPTAHRVFRDEVPVARAQASSPEISRPAVSRGPASLAPSIKMPSALPAAPVDLAAFLQGFSIADVHEACEFTRDRFLDQTVAAHAKMVGGLENHADHRAYLESLGVKLAEDEKYWLGRGEFEVNGERASLQVIMDSHDFLPDADADNSASCFRAYLTVHFAKDRPMTVSLDAGTDMLVTKNQTYYLNWESFGDAVIGRKLAVLQIPLPESKTSDLELMLSSNHSWLQAAGFQWEALPMEKALPMIEILDNDSSDPVASADQ